MPRYNKWFFENYENQLDNRQDLSGKHWEPEGYYSFDNPETNITVPTCIEEYGYNEKD